MNKCFCCKKETPLELLKSDDAVSDESRKFCPTCQKFSFSCHLCDKCYICVKYKESSDEYFYNDDEEDYYYHLEDKEELENDLYIIVPTGKKYYFAKQFIAKCKLCSVIICESCNVPFMETFNDSCDFFYCKKCVKNKIPEIISFGKNHVDFYNDDSIYDGGNELHKYSLLLMNTLIKEREEAKKLKKENIEYKKELLKTITPFPETIVEKICSYL